jgi:prepilin-type N-terminal cleavage/methylation domain-containing protein
MNKAFTLVELAIVIVVLGIMSAVIVGGKTIVDSANMNSTISQMNQYRLAHNAFVLEYDAIPGDMKDANDYNLNLDSEGNNTLCYTWNLGDSGDGTHQGNGDKMLQSSNTGIRFTGEISNYWIHLSNSGLI